MDRRFLTVVGLALIFALVVSMVFYQMISAPASPSAEPKGKQDVVIAATALDIGATIRPEDVRIEKISVANFPKGAFAKLEEVVDRPVVSRILADEAVLDGRLAAKGSGLGLAPIIPVGMRAVSVRVTDVAGVAGFVLPGLRVDVQVTGKPPGGSDSSVTTTCLQNLQVLSAGTKIEPNARGEAIQTPTVTLLATPEEAEILTLAGNEGRIQLVLRNSNDHEIAKTSGAEVGRLYGRHSAAPAPSTARKVRPKPKPEAAPSPAPPPPQVVVIRGNTRTVEAVPAKAN